MEGVIVVWVLLGVIVLGIQYLIIRAAVLSAIKNAAIWKADGGVEAVQQARAEAP